MCARTGLLPYAMERRGATSFDGRCPGLAHPEQKPFGLYFYIEDVWASKFWDEILGKNGPEVEPRDVRVCNV